LVFQWHELPNPVPDARVRIAKISPRTAENSALDTSNCNPVEVEAIRKLLPRLQGDCLTTVLLRHGAGLRIGEATGLQLVDINFGQDDSDESRSLLIQQTWVGNRVGNTKSGLARRVGMSRRLRRHLLTKSM